MLPVSALVFASKLPPVVSGQFTVTCALVTVSASSARAAAGARALTRTATPNRQFGRTFLIAFPPVEMRLRSQEGQPMCQSRTIGMLVRFEQARTRRGHNRLERSRSVQGRAKLA